MKLKDVLAAGWIVSAAFFFSSCVSTSPPAGVNIMVFGKPEVDITKIYTDQDEHMQRYVFVCDNSERTNEELSSKVITTVQKKFLRTKTYRIGNCENDTSGNHPKLFFKVLNYQVKDGYDGGKRWRRVSANIEFQLQTKDGKIEAPDTIYGVAGDSVERGLRLKEVLELENMLAGRLAEQFAKQIVPITKREFRGFDTSRSDVKDGVTNAKGGNWDLAIENWEDIIRKDKENAAAHYNLGIAYEVQKDYENAEKNYCRALKLDPGNELYSRTRGKFLRNWDMHKLMEESKQIIEDEDGGSDDTPLF